MFCYNCGANLEEGINFCPICGVKQNKKLGQNQAMVNKKEKINDTLLAEIGQLHDKFYCMSRILSEDFAETYTQKYMTLDGFVKRANEDVENIFERVDDCILEFLSHQGIFSYEKKQVQALSRKYATEWQDVYNGAVLAYENITGKLQNIKQAREYAKAGRGRLVGGGFGISGAVKGMATAGAVNMASGALYSMANGLANARSEEKARAEKNRFYYSKRLKEAIRLAIEYDIFAMLETVKIIIEKEKNTSFPYYSPNDYEKACNIQNKIDNEEIPDDKIETAIFQMLEIYPVSEQLYIYADKLFPDNTKILDMALKYGFNFEIIRNNQKAELSLAAISLEYSYLFIDNYQEVTYDFDDVLELLSRKYSEFLGYKVLLLTDEVKKKNSVKKILEKMHSSFAEYDEDEIPLLLYDASVFSSGSSGILLTDSYLYFKGENERTCRLKVADYEHTFCHMEKAPHDAIYKYYLDEKQEFYLYMNGGESGIIAVLLDVLVQFLVAYCYFWDASDVVFRDGEESTYIYQDVERVLDISMKDVYEQTINEDTVLSFLHQFICEDETEEAYSMMQEENPNYDNAGGSDVEDYSCEYMDSAEDIVKKIEDSVFDKVMDKSIYHEFFHPITNMNSQEMEQYKKIPSIYTTISDEEKILFFYDNTMFRNMKEGFVITNFGVHFHSDRLSSGYIRYNQIQGIYEKQIKLFPNLIINDQYTVPMRFLSGCSSEIISMVNYLCKCDE